MNPKISIITICYNSEKYLREAMESVLSQGYDNLEYIIIDGGSNDGTMLIVDEYRDRLGYVVSERDRGISDAFNKGIKAATGEIIGIINSDDILLPGALQAIAESYEADVDVYRGNIFAWNDVEDSRVKIVPTMELDLSKTVVNICHQSTFVTKRCYEKYGAFSTDFKYMMDADVLHRFYNAGVRFKYVDYDMALFRLGGVTDSSYKKKVGEISNLVLRNGGSKALAWYRCAYFVTYQTAKKLAYKILGGERARRLRYGH